VREDPPPEASTRLVGIFPDAKREDADAVRVDNLVIGKAHRPVVLDAVSQSGRALRLRWAND